MFQKVPDITDLPKKSRTKKKPRKATTAVFITVGVLLLVDDMVTRSRKKDEKSETPTD